MTGNGRHRTGIFSWLSPRHSQFIPGYENSQLDQKKPWSTVHYSRSDKQKLHAWPVLGLGIFLVLLELSSAWLSHVS